MAADHAVAGHHLIGHAEVEAAVRDQLVHFLEGAGIEQQLHALAGDELAGLVLAAQPLLAAAQLRQPFERVRACAMGSGITPRRRGC